MKILPKTKTKNNIEQDLQEELLVYNLNTHQAFALNHTLRLVYQACDGETSFDELKQKHKKFTDDLIFLSLDKLEANDLLENYQSEHFGDLSRREIVKRVGLASMIALPMISTLIAPFPAQAASTVPNTCTANVCLAPGTDTCNGCVGKTITYEIFLDNTTSCANLLTSTTLTCTGGNPQISNSDRRITSIV
jgi:hypothetical protein